jgi:hypothetical protein
MSLNEAVWWDHPDICSLSSMLLWGVWLCERLGKDLEEGMSAAIIQTQFSFDWESIFVRGLSQECLGSFLWLLSCSQLSVVPRCSKGSRSLNEGERAIIEHLEFSQNHPWVKIYEYAVWLVDTQLLSWGRAWSAHIVVILWVLSCRDLILILKSILYVFSSFVYLSSPGNCEHRFGFRLRFILLLEKSLHLCKPVSLPMKWG